MQQCCVDVIRKYLETAELYQSEELKNAITLFIFTTSGLLKNQGKWEKFKTLPNTLKLYLWNAVGPTVHDRTITCESSKYQ